MFRKTIAQVLIFVLAATILNGQDKPLTEAAPAPSLKPLKFAYTEHMPFCFTNSKGQVRGVLVDIWKEWSAKTGIPIQFRLMDWTDTISSVLDGKEDVNPGIFFSKERSASLDFSIPFYEQDVCIFCRNKDIPAENANDLADKQVGVVLNDFAENYIRTNQPKALLKTYRKYEDLIEGLLKQDVDYAILEKPVALNYLAQKNSLTEVARSSKPLYEEKYCAAVKKGNKEVLAKLNQGLKEISREEIDRIVKSWTGSPATKRRKIKVACLNNDPPFQYIGKDQRLMGIIIDFWDLLGERTGSEIEFTSVNREAEALKMLERGDVDCATGLSYQKNEKCPYLLPFLNCDYNFFYYKDISGIKDINDLQGFSVGVMKNSIVDEFLRVHLTGASLIRYDNIEEMMDAVRNKKLNVFAAKTALVQFYLNKNGLLEDFYYHPGKPLVRKKYYTYVRKDDNLILKQLLESGIRAITLNERFNIENKYVKLPEIPLKQTIVVSASLGYPPLSYTSSSGELHGIIIDLWKLWAKKLGRNVKFVISDWKKSVDSVKKGESDIHMGLFKTPEREKWMDFSMPIYEVESRVFYPTKVGILSSLDQLKGQKIGVIEGSYQEEYINKHCPDAMLVKFSSSDDMISSAAYGWIRAFMDEVPTAAYVLKRLHRDDQFKTIDNVSFRKKIYAATLKGNDKLIAEINKGLHMISDAEKENIESNFLKEEYRLYLSQNNIGLSEREKDWLKRQPNVIIGLGRSWPPLQYMGKDGMFKGIATDYVKLLNKKLKIKMRPERYLPWAEIIKKAEHRDIDVIPCIGPTPHRKSFLLFSKPYITFPSVIVTRKNNNSVRSLSDLYGKKVALLRGLAEHESLGKQHPDLSLIPVDSVLEGLNKVELGEATAFIGNLSTVSHIMQTHKLYDLKIAGTHKNNKLCFAVRSDWPELVSIINKAMATISQDQKDAILRRWLTVQPKPKKQKTYSEEFILRIILISSGFVLLMIVLNILNRSRIKRYLAILDNEYELVLVFRPSGKILYQSHSLKHLLGYSSGELEKAEILSLFAPEEQEKVKQAIESLEEGKLIDSFEHKLKSKQGNYLEFESYFVNKLSDMHLKGLIMHSKRKRREEEE